jgi:PIN domain nuclease of toxin-antitoxin system
LIYILDASAMIACLRGELGGQTVRDVLRDPTHQCYGHAINLCEVYYDFHRSSGETVARDALHDLGSAGVMRREDISIEFCQTVGSLKATIRRISLADCFAVTLAKLLSATILTADRHEFAALADETDFNVSFIR